MGARARKQLPGHRKDHFTEIVFLESASSGSANVCYFNRDYGIVGDPIYVGVFGQNAVTWLGSRYEPCALQSAAPNILQSSDKFPSALQSGGTWQLQTFAERRCYNTAVDLSIVGAAGEQSLSQRFPLQQYDRYRASLHAGILYTKLHDSNFALRADQADTSKKFIYDKGPSNAGPEYMATLDLYAALKYLPALFGSARPYPGRDPIHDQDFFDRLGAVLGVAITNPTRRFAAGASFEILYGVNVIWVADFARIGELAPNVSTTTTFKGAIGDIPTAFSWRKASTLGLSMDLRYVSTLLTGNR